MTEDVLTYNQELTTRRGTLMDNGSRPTVVVIGGGYGGVNVAKGLDEVADVVLVEPKDAFFHNIAALRALVDPDWLPRLFIPYDGLLKHGRVIRDRAVAVDGTTVVLSSGEEIRAAYVVLATGSSYPFPAKADADRAADSQDRVRAAHDALAQAQRVLLLGGGPVGVELAGEIHAAWPDKSVTIVDMADDIIGDRFSPELRTELRRQLADRGVEVLLGSPLQEGEPPTPAGDLSVFTVTTEDGHAVTADIWFRCFGVTPSSGYLTGPLAAARTADGFIQVNDHLQVVGRDSVFALGDVSTADAKMAGYAGRQAQVVVDNLTALITGQGDLTTYVSMGPAIAVTMGPEGGAGQFPGQDGVVSAEVIASVKSRSMMVERYAEILGAAPPS
jgi:NADH dehydrogenase FAD-containing subunit